MKSVARKGGMSRINVVWRRVKKQIHVEIVELRYQKNIGFVKHAEKREKQNTGNEHILRRPRTVKFVGKRLEVDLLTAGNARRKGRLKGTLNIIGGGEYGKRLVKILK